MKWLLWILLLLQCASTNAQQTVRICPEFQQTFTYYSFADGAGAWAWVMNNDTLSYTNTLTITWEEPGIYEIIVYFEAGCYVRPRNYKIEVIECVESVIYFPNSFTPNDDGINDLYGPKGIGITDLRWSIWNRWGEMLFESTDLDILPNECALWDGTTKKASQKYSSQQDIYVWKAEWKDANGHFGSGVGSIALISQ